MKKTPRLSIICITYNHEKYLEQALSSFIAQDTDYSYEIIVADDASSDDTQKIINEYASKHPSLVKPILRKKNIGAAENFKDAILSAKGDYIALCEGDDYWTDPKKIQTQVEIMDKDSSCMVVFHPVKVVFENGSFPDTIEPSRVGSFSLQKLLERNYIHTSSVMYRRKDYKALPVDVMPLDWYLHLYHAKDGSISFVNKVMSVYRRHDKGMWWDSSKENNDSLLIKFGVRWVGLYVALLEIFGNTPNYITVIRGSIITLLNRLLKIDEEQGTDLLGESMTKYPSIARLYINNVKESLSNLNDHSIEQAKIITHYVNLSKDLSLQLEKTSEQLSSTRQEMVILKSKRLLKIERKVKKIIFRKNETEVKS